MFCKELPERPLMRMCLSYPQFQQVWSLLFLVRMAAKGE